MSICYEIKLCFNTETNEINQIERLDACKMWLSVGNFNCSLYNK